MPRHFNYQSIQYAYLNQCPDPQRNGSVIICNRCSKKLDTYYKENQWFPIPKRPIENGGRFNKENCVIVCADCYTDVMEERQKSPAPESLFDDTPEN